MTRTHHLEIRLLLCVVATTVSIASPSGAAANTTASIDRFLVLRNTPPTTPTPVTIYADEFNNSAPPVHLMPEPPGGGVFANGTPGTYFVHGLPGGSEANGRLALDPASGVLVSTATGTGFFRSGAILLTDTNPMSPAGLKPIYDFSVRVRFDLVTPVANFDGYGIELNDSNPSTPANDFLQLFVQRTGTGEALIRLLSQRFATGQITVHDTDPFAPPPGAAFVALRLNHSAATVGDVLGGYLYANAQEQVYDPVSGQYTNILLTNPAADQYVTFLGAPGRIFLDNEGYARAAFLSVALVPEPGTYAMMIAGLAMLGWAARRRRRT